MIGRLGRILLFIAMMSLLSLFLATCNLSTGGTNDGSEGANIPARSAPSVSPNAVNVTAVRSTREAGANVSVPAEESPKAAQNQIVIENFAFKPATLTIKPGTKVTWVNRDDVPHTANETDNRFKSGTLDTDGEFSFSFTTAGTYNYFCALHPKMTGQIIVK
jgi:plastocyanin